MHPTTRFEAIALSLQMAGVAVPGCRRLPHQTVSYPLFRATVSPSPSGSNERSTRSSRCRTSLKCRSATVSASATSGSATRPLHKRVVDQHQPTRPQQREGPLVVRQVVRLVGVDEREIESPAVPLAISASSVSVAGASRNSILCSTPARCQ